MPRSPFENSSACVLACALAFMTSGCAFDASPDAAGQEEDIATTSDGLGFEEWKETVRVRPGRDVYAVGEKASPMGLVGDKDARAYYDRYVTKELALILHSGQRVPGDPMVGSYFEPGAVLTYCIDRTGLEDVVLRYTPDLRGKDLYGMLENAFSAAAAAWSLTSGVTFVHMSERDRSCEPSPGDTLTWYVRPIFQEGNVEYLTFVLHPRHNRELGPDFREFLIWEFVLAELANNSLAIPPGHFQEMFTLQGLMLRAIGQGLGFVAEENRLDMGGGVPWPAHCRQADVGGIYLTVPDPFSVMTHPMNMQPIMANPDCSGLRQFDYVLTYVDAMGASCQYQTQNILYYCSEDAQRALQNSVPGDCSPAPIAGTPDCGGAHVWDAPARDYHAAVLSLLSSN